MPAHSQEKEGSNRHEEMEVDYPEQEGSSLDADDTESSSVSDDGDSSGKNCFTNLECLNEMTNLEKLFGDLKDQLYKERLSQVDEKLQEVIVGKENMQIRAKVGGIYGGALCTVCKKQDCVNQAAFQHWEVSIAAGKSTFHRSTHVPGMQASHLLAKFAVLEPKWVTYLWNDELQSRKNKRKDQFSPDKKKKPVLVSDILFHHLNLDILQDWTAIRKAVATLGPHGGKTDVTTNKNVKQQRNTRSEEGKLFYDGEWYCRGQTICIDKKDEFPTSAGVQSQNNNNKWSLFQYFRSSLYVPMPSLVGKIKTDMEKMNFQTLIFYRFALTVAQSHSINVQYKWTNTVRSIESYSISASNVL
uniref:BRMS1 like transcriptional repressor a n=1 Tax=Salmo trutta TaxID=8032 RepID=A0A674ARW5_SALTR